MPSTSFEGMTLSYLHFPAAAAGAPRLLYIHGTGCRAQVFEAHFAALGDDFERVAVDLPGHGGSGGLGFRGMADYAASVAAVIRALAWPDAIVAGHSLGGGVALALALYDAPLVSALMLVDSGARLRVAPAIIRAARAAAAGTAPVRSNPRLGFHADTPDSVVDAVRRANGECDPAVLARDWIADDSCDFMSRLGSIEVPTLAVCGRDDELTPLKYHRYLERELPDCRLEIIDGAGHWPFAEQPAAFNAVVREFVDAQR
ncbi:MAG: alpha/beta fold hydrolase [Gammaproteobacteria bacterium]